MKKSNKTNITLRYKQSKIGLELDLVKSFINSFDKIFYKASPNVRLFEEPYIDMNIPDIVIVFWDEDIFDYWAMERNFLQKRDIKILHHMFVKNGFSDVDMLINELGYSVREIENTLEKLIKADLLTERNQKFKIKEIKKVFFVRAIITIEAKIKDWKKAFEQAWLNESFASESYVLLPQNRISSKVIEHANKLDIGIIGHEKRNSNIVKSPNKKIIPSSYLSWLFNENIGRDLYYAKL
ncbi:MAG TPA: hypothetical protein VK469_10840 [Candidatus Kapabacteria bacterium]|nr:hypothetical protein [Candidatus Kapabacteria bacterium]